MDRSEAEAAMRVLAAQYRDQPRPALELFTKRQADCVDLLNKLVGVRTVRLSPSAFAIFAANGYGEMIVRQAVYKLVRAGLAELRWDVHGVQRVPCVRAAA